MSIYKQHLNNNMARIRLPMDPLVGHSIALWHAASETDRLFIAVPRLPLGALPGGDGFLNFDMIATTTMPKQPAAIDPTPSYAKLTQSAQTRIDDTKAPIKSVQQREFGHTWIDLS
jgi:hypothetical protein